MLSINVFIFTSRLRHKQTHHPVVLLTQGLTDQYPAYRDPRAGRGGFASSAVAFASAADLAGVNVLASEAAKAPEKVREVREKWGQVGQVLCHNLITRINSLKFHAWFHVNSGITSNTRIRFLPRALLNNPNFEVWLHLHKSIAPFRFY